MKRRSPSDFDDLDLYRRHDVLWKRLDSSGGDGGFIERLDSGYKLIGAAVFEEDGIRQTVQYTIRCTNDWRTASCQVAYETTDRKIELDIHANDGRWSLNSEPVAAVAGSVDIDLAFSPMTNLLPIRRLGLKVGESATITVAWLRFPDFDLHPLQQTYTRLANRAFRFETLEGTFSRDLTVDEFGAIVHYPGLWGAPGQS